MFYNSITRENNTIKALILRVILHIELRLMIMLHRDTNRYSNANSRRMLTSFVLKPVFITLPNCVNRTLVSSK